MIKRFQKKDLHDDRLVSSLRAFGRHDAHSLTSLIPNATYMTNLRAWSILTQISIRLLNVMVCILCSHMNSWATVLILSMLICTHIVYVT